MQYVKDTPSISLVSYSTRVAPLLEGQVTVETEAEAEEAVGKEYVDAPRRRCASAAIL